MFACRAAGSLDGPASAEWGRSAVGSRLADSAEPRVVRRPKLTITDPGLAARLLGGRLRSSDPELAGRLVETFIVSELRAQAEWSQAQPNLFHFRDRDGAEVDLVTESGDGRVVGIEAKSGATVRAEDLRRLRLLEHRFGPDFVTGVVFCTAPEPHRLGGRLWILPISALWQSSATQAEGRWKRNGIGPDSPSVGHETVSDRTAHADDPAATR